METTVEKKQAYRVGVSSMAAIVAVSLITFVVAPAGIMDGAAGFKAQIEFYKITNALGPFVFETEKEVFEFTEPISVQEFLQSSGVKESSVTVCKVHFDTCSGIEKDSGDYILQNGDLIRVHFD